MNLVGKVNGLLHHKVERDERLKTNDTAPADSSVNEIERIKRYVTLLEKVVSNSEHGESYELQQIYDEIHDRIVVGYQEKGRKEKQKEIQKEIAGVAYKKLKGQLEDAEDPTLQSEAAIKVLVTITAVNKGGVPPISGNGKGYEIVPTLHQLFPGLSNIEANRAIEALVGGGYIAFSNNLYVITPKINNQLGYQK